MAAEPTVKVPRGATIYACLENGRPCDPRYKAVYMWTYTDDPCWYYVRETPVPRG